MQWLEAVVPGVVVPPAMGYASILATVASPAELLVTDPQGRRTGTDPRKDASFNEIPNVAYFTEAIADPGGTGGTGHPIKTFSSWAPLDGDYIIQVIGTGSGSYTFDVLTHDKAGNPSYTTSSQQIQVGTVDEYHMSYLSTPGTPVSIVLDKTPPTTAAALLPVSNAAGWNTVPVMVTLSAVDNPGGSGVQSITYSASGAQPVPNTAVLGSTAAISITTDGQTLISYFAADIAGNVEITKIIAVKLDETPLTQLSAVQYQWGSPAPGYSYASWPIFESWMQVRIQNIGPADAFNVTATIAAVPPNVTVVTGTVQLGNIPVGQSAWSTGSFRIRTDMAHPANRCAGVTWRIEYDDPLGMHRVLDNVPQFPPGKAPGGCN